MGERSRQTLKKGPREPPRHQVVDSGKTMRVTKGPLTNGRMGGHKKGPGSAGEMTQWHYPHLYFRVNHCDTGYPICSQDMDVSCDLFNQIAHSQNCIPAQLSTIAKRCNHDGKICEGAEWCDGDVLARSILRQSEWLPGGCADMIVQECQLLEHCFHQCQTTQGCHFFATQSTASSTSNCRTFSRLERYGFRSTDCGPWKIFKTTIAANIPTRKGPTEANLSKEGTAARTTKAEDSTTVSNPSPL